MDIGSSRDSQIDGESDDEAFLPSEATGPPPSWHAASSTTLATSDLDSNLSPAVRALIYVGAGILGAVSFRFLNNLHSRA